jgi:hypothetical protein
VWSKYTALAFVGIGLIMLGVGMTTLRYQAVAAASSRAEQPPQPQSMTPSPTTITEVVANGTTSPNDVNVTTTTTTGRTSAAADAAAAAAMSSATDPPSFLADDNPQTMSSTSSILWPLSAAQVAEENKITFGKLASLMVPLWFSHTVQAVDTIVGGIIAAESSRPSPLPLSNTAVHAVSKTVPLKKLSSSSLENDWWLFRTRKLFFYTRELLEVFSPVYDPSYHSATMTTPPLNGNDGDSDNMDDDDDDHYSNVDDEGDDGEDVDHNTVLDIHGRRALLQSFSSSSSEKVSTDDFWYTIRSFLDRGYTVLGNFQNAVKNETFESKVKKQEQVNLRLKQMIEWKEAFTSFHRQTLSDDSQRFQVFEYLESPSLLQKGGFDHEKESALFWKGIPNKAKGNELAASALSRLGQAQLTRIQVHLKQLMSETGSSSRSSTKKVPLRETIHSLRKELRTFTDEQELFQEFFIPSTADSDKHMVLLKETRDLLGDLNDDWVQWENEQERSAFLPKKQKHQAEKAAEKKLKSTLLQQWKAFQIWANTVKLNVVLQKLLEDLVIQEENNKGQ